VTDKEQARKADVDAWMQDPITQDFVALVMRATIIHRENFIGGMRVEDRGAVLALRMVTEEIMAIGLFEVNQQKLIAEAPLVAEDALAVMRTTDG